MTCPKTSSIAIGTSEIEAAILELLAARGHLKTACPSEVARLIAQRRTGQDTPAIDWRDLMEPVRIQAQHLQSQGRIRITQKGQPVFGDQMRGPIRLGLNETEPESGSGASGEIPANE